MGESKKNYFFANDIEGNNIINLNSTTTTSITVVTSISSTNSTASTSVTITTQTIYFDGGIVQDLSTASSTSIIDV
jgi:hypothetical protein